MYSKLKQQSLVEIEFPFASAIEACFQLDEYKNLSSHSHSWVSDRILVSEPLVRKAITALLKVGTISKIENKYHVNNRGVQIPNLVPDQAVKFDHYWTSRCLDYYKDLSEVPYTPKNSANFRHFRIAPVSDDAAKAIQTLLRQTTQRMLKIIEDDKNKKNKIAVYVNHFFDAKDIKWIKTEE